MASPHKLNKLREQHGERLPEIVVDMLNRLGSMEKVAVELEMSYVTVFNLCKQLGIEKQVTYVLPERMPNGSL